MAVLRRQCYLPVMAGAELQTRGHGHALFFCLLRPVASHSAFGLSRSSAFHRDTEGLSFCNDTGTLVLRTEDRIFPISPQPIDPCSLSTVFEFPSRPTMGEMMDGSRGALPRLALFIIGEPLFLLYIGSWRRKTTRLSENHSIVTSADPEMKCFKSQQKYCKLSSYISLSLS